MIYIIFSSANIQFDRYMTDYAIMYVGMYECIPVRRWCIIMYLVVSYFITE